jgi:hypothetical protein
MARRQKHARTPKPPIKERRPDQKIKSGITRTARQLIGTVIASWSALDASLQSAIWAFLRLSDDDGRLVTSRMNTRPKIEWLGVLGVRYLPDGDYAKKFFETLARISELSDDRNFIAHGVWATLKPEHHPIAMSLRKSTPLGTLVGETFSAERMRHILHDIEVARAVIRELPKQLAASRGK